MKIKLMWQRTKKTLFRLLLIGVIFFVFLVIYLDSQVKNEFKQQAWNIPAKVYARPLSFSVGKQISLKDLLLELNLLGYRKKIKATHQGEFEQYQNSLVIYTRPFKFWDGEQRAQLLEVTITNGQISELKDFATQKSVNFLRLDPLSLGSIQAGNNEDRVLVSLEQLPEHFLAALLNTEDKDFYAHWGISLKGIARAAWSNLTQGELRQGGSTLTQQLMKNHFLTRERSLWRKLREAIMAVLMEVHYDKKLILEAYLNEVYLGQDNTVGIHGFARASEFYFDRPLEKLNLNQVALLVGMVKGPSLYNPRRNPENALARRNLVLNLMLDSGLITDEEYQDATSRNLQVIAKPKNKTSKVPAFVGFIKRELRQEYSLSELNNQGLRLFTSLDPVVQQYSEESLKKRLAKIESARAENNKELQGALIVSDIHTGDILAMVGDRNPNYVGFNRAVDAYRQTGSVIKPFVYLTALKQPESFNMTTLLKDESFSLEGEDGSIWTPKNYDSEVHGNVELQDSLINSYNIATARLALAVGVSDVVDTITDAGFERVLPAYPSIALGAKEMSPLEVLRLYQTLANNGVGVSSSGLVAVQDHQGNLLQRYRRTAQARLDSETAFLVKYLLTQVVKRGTAKSIGQTFGKKEYAGKTGTTNDLRDSWYAGFGGNRLAVVWVGRDDNKPSGLTGASGALKVWRDLFVKLNEASVDLTIPEELVWAYKAESFFSGFGSCKSKTLVPFYLEQLPKDFKICD